MSDFIFKIDHSVGKFFHKIYLWSGDVGNNIMKIISYFGDAGILFIIVGLTLILFKKTRKVGFTALFAIALGFLLTNVLLKNIIERARPFENMSSDFYKWWIGAGATNVSGFSFPSGHTTATTAFSVAIFLTTNKKYSWPILLFPILMASSRIYLMVHYFSDCVGGLLVGSVVAIMAYLIAKWIYSTKIKFFVWIRNVNILTLKSVDNSAVPATTNTKIEEQSVEEFVYSTQDEEKKNNPSSTENKNISTEDDNKQNKP